MRILEIGPSDIPSPFYKIVKKRHVSWETIDVATYVPITYKMSNEYKFPIPNGMYDIVISANVIEHVRKTWVWIKEVARVCRKGGHVITIVPISWPYHRAPVDCWRIYPDGMRVLYETAGLHVDLCTFESLEKVGYRRIFPGPTEGKTHYKTGQQDKEPFIKSFLKDIVRWPTTASFDTIAIGTKVQ